MKGPTSTTDSKKSNYDSSGGPGPQGFEKKPWGSRCPSLQAEILMSPMFGGKLLRHCLHKTMFKAIQL